MTDFSRSVGVFGGTFNPVHFGHLRVAEEIFEALSLHGLIWMPAADPPHKNRRSLASFQDRLLMLRMAVKDRPGFLVSDLEGRLEGPSYTVNTLQALRKMGPVASRGEADQGGDPGFACAGSLSRFSLCFLVGFDSFKQVGCWRDYRKLFQLASFVVFMRPGVRGGRESIEKVLSTFLGKGWKWDRNSRIFTQESFLPVRFFRQESMLCLSSTVLRKRLEDGGSVRYLVPDVVEKYIRRRDLYRGG